MYTIFLNILEAVPPVLPKFTRTFSENSKISFNIDKYSPKLNKNRNLSS